MVKMKDGQIMEEGMDVGWLGELVGSLSTCHDIIGPWVLQLGYYLILCQNQ